MLPSSKSPHSVIETEESSKSSVTIQPASTPLTLKELNSTSPLENWNLTVLSKPTADTVIVFSPKTKSAPAFEGPKAELPLAVVLKTLYFAPPSGK